MKIVQKYGGSSLADAECVRRVARRICADAENNQMLVVVSAQGKTTDLLTKKYKELSQQFPGRESDALLVCGELASAALLTATLNEMGKNAISLNGVQIPILVSGSFGDGRIVDIDTSRIENAWKDGKIVVITGFQGVNEQGDFITLGRGGSDTSAVAIAAALHAERCMIFTDVDGVYSTDPGKEPNAIRFDSIHSDTMLDLARNGAKVLHPRAAELGKQYEVPIEVLTSFSRRQGTVISEKSSRQNGVTSCDHCNGIATVSIVAKEALSGKMLWRICQIFLNSGDQIRFGRNILKGIVPSETVQQTIKTIHGILYPER